MSDNISPNPTNPKAPETETPETPSATEGGAPEEHVVVANVTIKKVGGPAKSALHGLLWLVCGLWHLLHHLFHAIWHIVKRLLGVSRPLEFVTHSYPNFIWSWPLIVMGYVFWATQDAGWISPVTASWIWLIALGIIFIAMGVDIGLWPFLVLCVVIAFITVCIMYANHVLGWVIFINIGHALKQLKPEVSVDLSFISSLFLSIAYAIMIVNAKLNDCLEMDANCVSLLRFLRRSPNFPRDKCDIYWDFPDMFAMILGLGAGDITVIHENKAYSFTNVPFLWFRLWWIKKILETKQVTNEPGAALT